MEAGSNRPIAELALRASYSVDTNWLPVRMGKDLGAVTDTGVTGAMVQVSLQEFLGR